MKTIARFFIFVIMMFYICACASNRKLAEQKSSIRPLSDTSVIREGSIVYGLPRTVFTVDVTMERTIEIPGPYASYASDLLGQDP